MSNESVIDLRTPPTSSRRPALSVAYGGGGAVGIAWHLGVIHALRDVGLDPATAPCVGTSAGAWACGAARCDLGFADFEQLGHLELPDRRPGVLRDLAQQVFGEIHITDAAISVVSLPNMSQRLIDSREYPIADLVAASSAVPGVFSPHPLGRTTYVDGGVRSIASAASAPAADLLVASLPLAGQLFGAVGRALERSGRRAVRQWRRRHGGDTIVLRPGRRIAEIIGHRPSALMDVDLAHRVFPVAYATARERLELRLDQLDRRDMAIAVPV